MGKDKKDKKKSWGSSSSSSSSSKEKSKEPKQYDSTKRMVLEDTLTIGPPHDGKLNETNRNDYNTKVLPNWIASLKKDHSKAAEFKKGKTNLPLSYGGESRLNCRYKGEMIDGKAYGEGTAEIGSQSK